MKTLYVSDLDGTLLTSDQNLSPYTADTINSLIHKGMLFTYATARSFYTAKVVTKELNINLPLIVYNGTLIMDNDGNIISKNTFDDAAKDLVDDLIQGGVYPIVYSFIDGKERFSFIKELCSEETKKFLATKENDERENSCSDTEALTQGEIFHLTCIDKKEKLLPFYEKYKEKYNCIFFFDMYIHEYWLELTPKNVSKARALLQLKEYLGCDKAIVFGDGENDVEFFAAADEAYATENAIPLLKEKATDVIGNHNADGVAEWLRDNF